jgi:hypothetical protein
VSGLHFHDLGHTGNALAAQVASLRELMGRMGRSSTRTAVIYQHASRQRERAIGAAVSALVEASSGVERARGATDRGSAAEQPAGSKATSAPDLLSGRLERVMGIEPALSAWEVTRDVPHVERLRPSPPPGGSERLGPISQSSMSKTELKLSWWTPPYATGWNLNRDSTVTAVCSSGRAWSWMVTLSPQDRPVTPVLARITPAAGSEPTIRNLVPGKWASSVENTVGGGWG